MMSSGCGGEACDDISCEDSVVLQADLTETVDALGGASVSFCRNGTCAAGTLSTVATGGIDALIAATTFRVQVWAYSLTDGSTLATFRYLSGGSAGGDTALADGDVYSVTVASASGATLLNTEGIAAHYKTVHVGNCSPKTCYEFIDIM